jgi:hypothetical protein
VQPQARPWMRTTRPDKGVVGSADREEAQIRSKGADGAGGYNRIDEVTNAYRGLAKQQARVESSGHTTEETEYTGTGKPLTDPLTNVLELVTAWKMIKERGIGGNRDHLAVLIFEKHVIKDVSRRKVQKEVHIPSDEDFEWCITRVASELAAILFHR